MAEFPAMPLWTDAYLADTGHLTTLEHGAYLLLLMAMWRSSSKSIPADDVRMARTCRLGLHQWRRMKPTIVEFLRLDEESMTYTQGRLLDEARAVEQKRESQKTNARAKWRKFRETRDAVASKRQCQTAATLNPYPLTPHTNQKTDLHTPPEQLSLEGPVNGSGKAHAAPAKPADKPRRKKPEIALPEGWRPDVGYARSLGLADREINLQANKFADYCRAHDKRYCDFEAAWRNWVRSYIERRAH